MYQGWKLNDGDKTKQACKVHKENLRQLINIYKGVVKYLLSFPLKLLSTSKLRFLNCNISFYWLGHDQRSLDNGHL